MNRAFEREQQQWHDEVGDLAAQLVRDGTPPFDALNQARDMVSRRRKEAAKERRVTELYSGSRP